MWEPKFQTYMHNETYLWGRYKGRYGCDCFPSSSQKMVVMKDSGMKLPDQVFFFKGSEQKDQMFTQQQ